jgi:hypothetical protein
MGYPVGIELRLGMSDPLSAHPLAQSVALLPMALWHTSMALALDEAAQVSKPFLPTIRSRVPAPTSNCFEPGESVGVELPLK